MMAMIATPYRFEANLSDEEFKKLGQFALRWSHMDHTIGNCLRSLLELSPKRANIMIFPISTDQRMARIEQLSRLQPLSDESRALFLELKPLIKAMQFLRNTALHGIVIDLGDNDEPYFELRSKQRKLTKAQLFGCEDLINYAAHVVTAFRLSLGDKEQEPWHYTLPDRPPIPEFLPSECRAFPKADRAAPESPPESSPP